MTCSILWMAWCEDWLSRRLQGRTTCYSLWGLHDRSCPNTAPKWLQRWVWFTLLHISSIFSRSCDHLESGTREWIIILRTRHHILPNTKRPFWSTWRMNTVPNIEMCRSISRNVYRAAISSPRKPLQDSVKCLVSHMIHPAIMKNTWHLTVWLRRHPDEEIAQHVYWPLPGYIWIPCLGHERTGCKLIQMSMITTPTLWRLAVHGGYRT